MNRFRSFFCFLNFHSFERKRRYCYIEESGNEITINWFSEFQCKFCGKVIKPDCCKPEWRKKHKPLSIERTDYGAGVLPDKIWDYWELTKDRLGI